MLWLREMNVMSTGLDVIVAHDGLMRNLRFLSFCFKHQVSRVKTNKIRTFKVSNRLLEQCQGIFGPVVYFMNIHHMWDSDELILGSTLSAQFFAVSYSCSCTVSNANDLKLCGVCPILSNCNESPDSFERLQRDWTWNLRGNKGRHVFDLTRVL